MKKYIFLLLFAISCFMYGVYTWSTITKTKEVKQHQWVLTGFFGLMFGLLTINEFKKNGE